MTDQAELDQQADVDLDELERLHEAAPTREVMSYLIGGGALEFYAAAKSAVPKLLALARRALARPEATSSSDLPRRVRELRDYVNVIANDNVPCSPLAGRVVELLTELVESDPETPDVHRLRSEMCERFLREHGNRLRQSVQRYVATFGADPCEEALDTLMKEFGIK